MVGYLRWLCFAGLFASALAQTGNQEQPILRMTVNLVQVDAVVTDSGGRQVSDLTANDFEILEDGRPQKITAFSYVSTGERRSSHIGTNTPPAISVPRPPVNPPPPPLI